MKKYLLFIAALFVWIQATAQEKTGLSCLDSYGYYFGMPKKDAEFLIRKECNWEFKIPDAPLHPLGGKKYDFGDEWDVRYMFSDGKLNEVWLEKRHIFSPKQAKKIKENINISIKHNKWQVLDLDSLQEKDYDVWRTFRVKDFEFPAQQVITNEKSSFAAVPIWFEESSTFFIFLYYSERMKEEKMTKSAQIIFNDSVTY